jgi:maltose O-acetyltransferase
MGRHFVNIILSFLPPSRLFFFRRLCLRIVGIGMGQGVSFCGRGWIYGRGPLKIGDHTWLSPGIVFYTNTKASIVIGNKCDIGPGVEFITGGHLIGGADRRAGEGTALSISIGDGCWVGAKSIILGGVVIGSGSIVAAGSVVTKSIPAGSLVAGIPAVIKRTL